MLPPLASFEDFAARTPGGVAETDQERVEALLTDASSLVRAEAGRTWVDDAVQLADVPDVVVVVVIAAARRAFLNPQMVTRESAPGPFSADYANASPDVYLTTGEKAQVRRAAGRSGIWSMPVTRATSDLADVATLYPSYVGATGAPEEVDPFSEGWPG